VNRNPESSVKSLPQPRVQPVVKVHQVDPCLSVETLSASRAARSMQTVKIAARVQDVVASRFKSPRRVTITIPQTVYERLMVLSDEQGRSLSNLASFLLESSLMEPH
jgi:hypothetical protein